jgi:hypothetical protein
LIWRKSPDKVSRLNRFETCGSMHSQQPAIEAIVAVGAIATSSELRRPPAWIRARSASQRARSLGVTPHASNCSSPRAARVSSNAGWRPLSEASSVEAERAWK